MGGWGGEITRFPNPSLSMRAPQAVRFHPAPFFFFFVSAFFCVSWFPCIYLPVASLHSSGSGVAGRNVLPLQVMLPFTANVKHSAFFSTLPMNTEGGNAAESRFLLSFNSAPPPAFLRRLSRSTSALCTLCLVRGAHVVFPVLRPPEPALAASGTSATESRAGNCMFC